MATKGKIIRDEFTTIEFLETSADTDGKYVKFKFTTTSGGFKPVQHFHSKQDEHFKVLSGKLTYELNGAKQTIKAGEEVTLPRGVKHTHYNNEKEDLVMEQTVIPALDSEYFLESLFGLATEGKVKNGQPPLLQILLWLRKLNSKTYLAAIPMGIQNALSALLTPVARLRGYQVAYKRFSGVDI